MLCARRTPRQNISSSFLGFTYTSVKYQPITEKTYPITQETKEEPLLASTGFEHMKNPIKPLTSAISKKTKTDVEFKTAKPSQDKPSGFYLRIGKFEVSRKKQP